MDMNSDSSPTSGPPPVVQIAGDDFVLTLNRPRAHWLAMSLLHGHMQRADWVTDVIAALDSTPAQADAFRALLPPAPAAADVWAVVRQIMADTDQHQTEIAQALLDLLNEPSLPEGGVELAYAPQRTGGSAVAEAWAIAAEAERDVAIELARETSDLLADAEQVMSVATQTAAEAAATARAARAAAAVSAAVAVAEKVAVTARAVQAQADTVAASIAKVAQEQAEVAAASVAVGEEAAGARAAARTAIGVTLAVMVRAEETAAAAALVAHAAGQAAIEASEAAADAALTIELEMSTLALSVRDAADVTTRRVVNGVAASSARLAAARAAELALLAR
jgi:hypothetical protein